MPPLKAQLLLAESLAAYFPEMVFTDSGITVQIHRNTHWAREPVKRLRQFMFERDWWDEQQEQALLAEAGREVERAVAAYEAITPQAPETLLDYQFAELPKAYLAQRQRIIAKGMQQSGEGL